MLFMWTKYQSGRRP